jgi:hypothetical protein
MVAACCIFSLGLKSPLFAQPPAGKGYQLLLNEDFSTGTLNTDLWKYRIDRRTGMGYMDGLNIKEAVYVKDSALHVILKHEMVNGKWENTGGGIISKYNFGYGYYECLSKPFLAGRGVHSSFWQRGSHTPNNNVFEIDSYEIDAGTWVATNNLYVDLAPKGLKYSPWPHRAQVPFTTTPDGWFLDGYEFTPEGVIFYDNGKVVAKAEFPELNAHQAVWLTALNGVGKVDSTKLPAETIYKYFKYYGKDYPGYSILPNGNFEYNSNGHNVEMPMCWQPEGTKGALKVVEGDAYKDDYKLRIGGNLSHKNALRQSLHYIMNGSYQLSAMVRSSGGQKQAYIKVYGYGGTEQVIPIPTSSKWTRISIPTISVTNNLASFEIFAEGDAGQWIEIDDLSFMKPLPKGAKPIEHKPMFEKNGPIWQLAMKEPIEFTGDQKFYFFDRNVGYGDTMTLSVTITANEFANATPIARIPKTGNSGWSLQLQKDGSVLYRIGSMEQHTDVVAPAMYEPNKAVNITCLFESGTASIYKNGELVKQQTHITHQVKDATAAGRVGTVGKDFQAVGDVVMQMSATDKESAVMKNFRGKIHQLKIYNRKQLSK